uniref:uncharacterized protein LOC122587967 n=1 Tax=Erigeron canadensis TaxID=72917 RepID=UPI001CB8E8AB|nr:uncharacterized protein LOC122587967 [Erigeron canadensis]
MEWDELANLLNVVTIGDDDDKWGWRGGENNVFSVKNVKESLISNNDYTNRYVVKWCKWIPKKCNMFIWRTAMDRIPTKEALRVRGCGSGDFTCVFCGEGLETTTHLFCECIVAARVWHFISGWCRTTPFFVFNLKEILQVHEQQRRKKEEILAIKG